MSSAQAISSCHFPRPCLLTPPLAAATSARGTAIPLSRSTLDRSAPPPSRVSAAASVWRCRCRASLRVGAMAGVRRYGSCTCPMRINIAGSPVDRQRVKKVYKRGLSWPPSGPLPPGDALDAGPAHARRQRRSPSLAAFYHPACSHLRWLWPRRHAKEYDLPQRPHVVGQASGHRRRTRPPLLGGAIAMGGQGL